MKYSIKIPIPATNIIETNIDNKAENLIHYFEFFLLVEF